MANMKKYASGLIRPEDLHSTGPRQERIVNVTINDKLNAPILTFESGEEMVAWNNVARVLARSYGFEDTDWVGHVIELSISTYTNRDGEEKETIVVKPISARDDASKPQLPLKKDLDDEIPF